MSSVVDTNITVKLNDIEMAVYGMATTKQQYFTPTYYDEYDCTVSPAIREKPVYQYFRNNDMPEYDTIYQTGTDYKWVDGKGYIPTKADIIADEGTGLKYYIEDNHIVIYGLSDDNYSGIVKIPAKIGDYDVTKIADGAFRGSNLGSITFEKQKNITGIGMGAFYNCSDLTNITIPEKMKIISHHTFENCTNLTTVSFSIDENNTSNVSVIDSWAFANCEQFSNLTIPNGVKYIGRYTFRNCNKINDLEIPESVDKIDVGAFDGCWNGREGKVTFHKANNFEYDYNIFLNDFAMKIYIPIEGKKNYVNDNGTTIFLNIYSNDVLTYKIVGGNYEIV